jgi:hypothetical protein
MHFLLYLIALAAVAAALGMSIRDLELGAAPGLDQLESALRSHGLLLVGGVILAGLGRVLQHLRAIDVGLTRVAKAAEDAARLDG